MSSAPVMTTTSYAILGLLSVKSWTTHELVQQVDRSLRRFWPRAQSKLYEEPKKLVAHGFARATEDPVGQRRRTRYTITADGRRALAEWLSQPGDGPILECEQLLKVHFADAGTKANLLANLSATSAWVVEQNAENLAAARAYERGTGDYPERAALNLLVGRFLSDHYLMVAQWAQWATAVVQRWPDDLDRVVPDADDALETVRRAEAASAIAQSIA